VSTVLVDPTGEAPRPGRPRRPRPTALDGVAIGLLDAGRYRGETFLDRLEAPLAERGATVRRYAKRAFARVAEPELLERIAAECDVVLTGVADSGACATCSVHDLDALEERGKPAVAIVTSELAAAARHQAAALGLDGAFVVVPHPIEDRTEEEIGALAEAALEAVAAALIGADAHAGD
jgi:hypothetical protein